MLLYFLNPRRSSAHCNGKGYSTEVAWDLSFPFLFHLCERTFTRGSGGSVGLTCVFFTCAHSTGWKRRRILEKEVILPASSLERRSTHPPLQKRAICSRSVLQNEEGTPLKDFDRTRSRSTCVEYLLQHIIMWRWLAALVILASLAGVQGCRSKQDDERQPIHGTHVSCGMQTCVHMSHSSMTNSF